MPARMVGMYALACMERDGGVYGYSLAEGIAERTGGAWRPGPGAVYPALQRLAERGLARAHGAGRRREYRITPAGRALLRKVRRERGGPGSSGPDLSLLWAEVLGIPDYSTFLWLRLRRSLDSLEAYLERTPGSRVQGRPLREQILTELKSAQLRLARPSPGRQGIRRRPRRGS